MSDTTDGLIARTAERLGRILDESAAAFLPAEGSPTPLPPLARLIDHTLLKPEATAHDVVRLCTEARQYGLGAVCVNPCWVSLAASELRGSTTAVASVCSFPLGASSSAIKAREAEQSMAAGAAEIDMVMAIGPLLAGDYAVVRADLGEVRRATTGRVLKVIIETCLLGEEDKVAAAMLVRYAQADYVKTSTGFGRAGAVAADVALLRAVVGPVLGVKASGGIRDRAAAEAMLAAGASRLGTSAGPAIVAGS